jgi:hypothetical protein
VSAVLAIFRGGGAVGLLREIRPRPVTKFLYLREPAVIGANHHGGETRRLRRLRARCLAEGVAWLLWALVPGSLLLLPLGFWCWQRWRVAPRRRGQAYHENPGGVPAPREEAGGECNAMCSSSRISRTSPS